MHHPQVHVRTFCCLLLALCLHHFAQLVDGTRSSLEMLLRSLFPARASVFSGNRLFPVSLFLSDLASHMLVCTSLAPQHPSAARFLHMTCSTQAGAKQ